MGSRVSRGQTLYNCHNLYMGLVQAIKNSSSFFSGEECYSDGKHEYSEGGDASFHGTVNGINLYCIGYYIIKGSNEPGFYGFGTDGDHYYLKNINPTDIPRIIKQIQKEDRNEQK